MNLTEADLNDPNQSPFICGSIVNGGFSRKLKMMRGDMFALMSISQSIDFIKDEHQSREFKKGILNICHQSEKRPEVEETIKSRCRGWNRFLYDKCYNNLIWDTHIVNQPSCLKQRDMGQDAKVYAYACFLPAGQHQLLIYDPKTNRAYCKDIVVDLGTKEFYADLP